MIQIPIEDIKIEEKSKKPILELKEYDEKEFLIGRIKEYSENDVKLSEFLTNKIKIIPTQKGIWANAGSYIGSAEFEEFIIQVIPKFSEIEKLPLLIDYAWEIEDKDIVETELRFQSDRNFPVECLIRSLVNQCQKLMKIGLSKSYVNVEDNLPYLRGRLLLAQQINNDARMNLKFGCEYDEFSSNIIENQIILFILEKSYNITQNDDTKQQIQKLIHEFDMEVNYKIIESRNFEIYYDRYNSHYEKIHLVCKLIFEELGVSDFYKYNTSYIFPVFIDMARLFEKYVVRLLSDYSDDKMYDIKSQPKTGSIAWKTMEMVDEKNKRIEPDIIIYSKKPRREVAIIADVKYMESRKFGESQLYQIGFYLHEHRKQMGFALIPDSDKSIEIKWESINQNISIHLKKIPVDEILDIIYSRNINRDEKIKDMLQKKIPIFNPSIIDK
jgi:5-methylcytosine-specific restriction enzyme subunit McrC